MRMAVIHALEVLDKYGLTEAQIDLDHLTEIANSEGIIRHWFTFKGRLRERYLVSEDGIPLIAIASYLKAPGAWALAELRHLSAHALGHHFMHRGSYLYVDSVMQCKKEEQADSFAAVALISPHQLMLNSGPWTRAKDLADIFMVPLKLAEKRVKIYEAMRK